MFILFPHFQEEVSGNELEKDPWEWYDFLFNFCSIPFFTEKIELQQTIIFLSVSLPLLYVIYMLFFLLILGILLL